MRTAILLCGMPREFPETWESFIENLYSQMPNPDVYIYAPSPYEVPEFFSIVKPKAYVVEPQFRHTHLEPFLSSIGFYAEHRIDPTIQQFYGLKKVWELKQSVGEKYDLVIRTRPDLIYLTPITLDILDTEELNNLHANFAPSMCTEFAAGPEHLIEKYCGIYDWLDGEGRKLLDQNNPRLNYPLDHKYNCDLLMISYIEDYLGIQLARQRLPKETPSPYDYYRIMGRHKKGEYIYEGADAYLKNSKV